MALAQAGDMSAAIGQAIEHLEKQAIKYKTKWRTKKRKPQDKWNGAAEPSETVKPVNGKRSTPVAPILVHKYPAVAKSTEFICARIGFCGHASHDGGRGY